MPEDLRREPRVHVAAKWRCLLAAAIAVGLFIAANHPFLPYSERERAQTAAGFVTLLGAGLIVGFSLGLRQGRKNYFAAAFFAGGLILSNAVVIGLDWAQDATTHNLFPFEFIVLGILSTPAFVGAGVARLIDRLRPR